MPGYQPLLARTRTIHRPVGPVAYDCVKIIVVQSDGCDAHGFYRTGHARPEHDDARVDEHDRPRVSNRLRSSWYTNGKRASCGRLDPSRTSLPLTMSPAAEDVSLSCEYHFAVTVSDGRAQLAFVEAR